MSVRPAGPVVLGEAVLDRDDRVAGDPVGPQVDELAGVEGPALLREHVARRRARRRRSPARPARSTPGRARSRSRRPACSRPARSPAGSPRPRPRSTASDGAKPPSSPWPVAWPSSWRIVRSAAKISAPGAERLRERGRGPTGMTMNSWKSVESWACLPPLRMLNIGTGQDPRADAAEPAVQRHLVRARGRVGAGERHAEDRVGAELGLVGRPVELEQDVVDARLVRRVEAQRSTARCGRSRSRPPSGRPCRRSGPCRRPAARPPRGPRSRPRTAPPPGRASRPP